MHVCAYVPKHESVIVTMCVCVCVCVCVWVCVCVCVHTCACMCVYACVCVCTHMLQTCSEDSARHMALCMVYTAGYTCACRSHAHSCFHTW